jgi:hypothetical protein
MPDIDIVPPVLKQRVIPVGYNQVSQDWAHVRRLRDLPLSQWKRAPMLLGALGGPVSEARVLGRAGRGTHAGPEL